MDGTTEPIIVVIGHPIAGNPTQFALESGFEAAQIDCRVLSVDLPGSRLAAALAGMDAMRFRAVWVTPSCRISTANHLGLSQSALGRGRIDPAQERLGDSEAKGRPENTTDSPPENPQAVQFEGTRFSFLLDLLIHDPAAASFDSWSHHSMKQQVWPGLVETRMKTRNAFCGRVWWIDSHADLSTNAKTLQQQTVLDQLHSEKNKRYENLTRQQIEIVHDVMQVRTNPLTKQSDKEHSGGAAEGDNGEQAAGMQLIVFADCENAPPANWTSPPNSLIIDLNENWDADYLLAWDRFKRAAAGDSNRDCLRGIDVHAACLSKLIQILFGHTVSPDIFLDAIDEYLAV